MTMIASVRSVWMPLAGGRSGRLATGLLVLLESATLDSISD